MLLFQRVLAGRAACAAAVRARAIGTVGTHPRAAQATWTAAVGSQVTGGSLGWALLTPVWTTSTRAFSTHPPEVSPETRGLSGVVRALSALDSPSRIEFLKRFERYKGLKRVASVSRQRFLLDCEKIFGFSEDNNETAAPLLHLLACMDSVSVGELQECLDGYSGEPHGGERAIDNAEYPVQRYISAEDAVEEYELKRKMKPVKESDGYMEDSESSDDEPLMAFRRLEPMSDEESDEACGLTAGGGGGSLESSESEHETGLDDADWGKETVGYAKVSEVPPQFFENPNLAIKCASCGEHFTDASRLFLVKAGTPIHIMSVDPDIREHVHLLKISDRGIPEYQCRCNSCRNSIGHMIRSFDGVAVRQRIALASRALVVEDLLTSIHGSLVQWKAHIVSQSVGRKIRREMYYARGLLPPYAINESDLEAVSARTKLSVGGKRCYELVCAETGDIVDPRSGEIRHVRSASAGHTRDRHRVFIPGKAIRLSPM